MRLRDRGGDRCRGGHHEKRQRFSAELPAYLVRFAVLMVHSTDRPVGWWPQASGAGLNLAPGRLNEASCGGRFRRNDTRWHFLPAQVSVRSAASALAATPIRHRIRGVVADEAASITVTVAGGAATSEHPVFRCEPPTRRIDAVRATLLPAIVNATCWPPTATWSR